MYKKITALVVILALIFSNTTYVFAIQSSLSSELGKCETFEVYGENYNIYSNEFNDGSIGKTVINPDGSIESYLLKENVLYDNNGGVIAKFIEEKEVVTSEYSMNDLEEEQMMSIMSFVESSTSPYPISDYTVDMGEISGHVVVEVGILSVTVGALVIIVGVIAPPIGIAVSTMLIAEGATRGIEEYAIYYKKHEYHHKYLFNLAKMFEVQWYWGPSFTEEAGDLSIYYSTFM